MTVQEGSTTSDDRHETLRTIGRQGARVSLAILLSRIFGFLRDMLIAQRFGTGAMADLFYVAYRIPNMLRELFAEGALSSAFIPALTRTLNKEGRREAERLYSGVFLLLSLILAPVILGGMLFAPEILSLLAPGWSIDPEKKSLGALMIRVMFPFLYFISLSALVMGVYNAQKRFFLPAASPIAFSLAVISAILLPDHLLPGPPVLRLALGVLVGGLSQWGIQWLLLKENRLRISDLLPVAKSWQNPRVRGVMARILPAVGGLWVTQGNLLIATLFASYLATGTIAALYYAMRLVQFPLGLIGAAVATVILPLFSLHARDGNGPQDKLSETLSHGYRASLFLMLPASAGLVALREPLIRLLFQHGQFNETSAAQTATALIGYAIGLWSFSGVRIIVRAFYATGDMKTPVIAALAGLFTNLVISALFSAKLGVFALAFGISAGSLANQSYLFFRLKSLLGHHPWAIFGNAPKVLLHSLLLLVVVRFLWLRIDGVLPKGSSPLLLSLLGLIGGGALLYGVLTALSGVTESRLLFERISGRFQRKKR